MPDETKANWVRELHTAIANVRADADFLHDLADAFYLTGNSRMSITLHATARGLRDTAGQIRKATSDATSGLLRTAQVGTFSTITTAITLTLENAGRRKHDAAKQAPDTTAQKGTTP